MKTVNIFKFMTAVMTVVFLLGVTSCGSDDKDDQASNIPSNLYGTWSGSVTTQKTGSVRSLSVTFNSDNTGSFRYSSRVYYRVAEFSYSMSGNTIKCKGVIVGEDGVINDFNQQFEYHNSYLVPIGAYTDFKLTK